jgi:sugar O-acyltransferase (sialic acid O-acetyltransferase NeuD family)
MKPLVVFGAGDIAELAEFYFRTDTQRKVAAFSVDAAFLKEVNFKGCPVVAFEELERSFPASEYDLFVALSYNRMNSLRAEKMEAAEAKGYALASYVSSHSYVWDGFEGQPNQFILEDNTLQPFCRIGRGVTLWSGNHIGHHSTIEEYCFVASHVVISGGVRIGAFSFLGVNATLRDHITLGRRCVVGAGAVLLGDAPDEAVFAATATGVAPFPSSRLRKL